MSDPNQLPGGATQSSQDVPASQDVPGPISFDGLESGSLLFRLAENEAEIQAAQRLRYRVFYDERAAKPTPDMAAVGRDFDHFDDFCDHMLVLDRTLGTGPDAVVGTYRVMRGANLKAAGRFYTADEYDIDHVVRHVTQAGQEVLELGRSCIDADYRNTATMTLLWRGVAHYVLHYNIGIMFGCASLPGTDPDTLAEPLSYLHHNHLAPEPLRPRAVESRFVDMARVPESAYNARRVLASLPPLIKGYLRLGGFVGDGAVVDHQFNTTDVCMLVKTDLVTDKYYKHYTREAS